MVYTVGTKFDDIMYGTEDSDTLKEWKGNDRIDLNGDNIDVVLSSDEDGVDTVYTNIDLTGARLVIEGSVVSSDVSLNWRGDRVDINVNDGRSIELFNYNWSSTRMVETISVDGADHNIFTLAGLNVTFDPFGGSSVLTGSSGVNNIIFGLGTGGTLNGADGDDVIYSAGDSVYGHDGNNGVVAYINGVTGWDTDDFINNGNLIVEV